MTKILNRDVNAKYMDVLRNYHNAGPYVAQLQFTDMLKNELGLLSRIMAKSTSTGEIEAATNSINKIAEVTNFIFDILPYSLMNKTSMDHIREKVHSSGKLYSLGHYLLRGYVAFCALPAIWDHIPPTFIVDSIPALNSVDSMLLSQENAARLFEYDAAIVMAELSKDKFLQYVYILVLGLNAHGASRLDFLDIEV